MQEGRNLISVQAAKILVANLHKNEGYWKWKKAYKDIKKTIDNLSDIESIRFFLTANLTHIHEKQNPELQTIAERSRDILDLISMKVLYELLPRNSTVFHLKDRTTYGNYYGYFYAIAYDEATKTYVPHSITSDIASALGLELTRFKSDSLFLRYAAKYSSSHDIEGLIEDLAILMYNDKTALKQQQMAW